VEAIKTGILWGLVGAVKELVSRTLPEGGDLWLTGGGGRLLAPHLGGSVRLDGDLVLKGLMRLLNAR
jgi:pantothenate kinase type III